MAYLPEGGLDSDVRSFGLGTVACKSAQLMSFRRKCDAHTLYGREFPFPFSLRSY